MTTAAARAADRRSSNATRRRRAPATRSGVMARAGKALSGNGAVIGAAAAGVVVGLLANVGRKAAVQAPSALTGDWLAMVKAEHRMALALFDRLQETTDAHKARRSTLLTMLKHAVAKHALSEENAIYPALRDYGDAPDADQLNHEHGYIKQYFYDLENMRKDSPDFLPKVAAFRKDIEHHMQEEEERIFPPMHEKLGPDGNKALTLAANKEGFKLA